MLRTKLAHVRSRVSVARWEIVGGFYRWTRTGGGKPVASIAINFLPSRSSWGGGNQWVLQMITFLSSNGFRVSFNLHSKVDCILLVDPRVGGFVTFGLEEIRIYKKQDPHVKCIHRINDGDAQRNAKILDSLLEQVNEVADHTVFISEWIRDYHAAAWFDKSRPHSIIYNAADSSIFHAIGGEVYDDSKRLRIVTHHWSDNWNKGFGVYQELDRLIAGRFMDVDFWVVGRWPAKVKWQAARTFGPTRGAKLAQILRQCHVYLTASVWEAGGMHHIEGSQCGLPVIYHMDGGGIVELASRYGVPLSDDIPETVKNMVVNYGTLRSKVLRCAPVGVQMCMEYSRIIDKLIAESHGNTREPV